MTLTTHPDGHPLLDGARWHSPKPGEPTACVTPGCTRVLGQQQIQEVDEASGESMVVEDLAEGLDVDAGPASAA